MNDNKEYLREQIEALRLKLLDLSMRNNLLNFRPSKRRTIRVIDEIPSEIYDILVLQEKNMRFNECDDDIYVSEPFENTWSSVFSNDIEKHHTDNKLQTDLDKNDLNKRITFIYRQSKSLFEEQGYSVLFLALGFLKWKESDISDDYRYAPLILIPVELERPEIKTQYILKWTGEDIFTNISLQNKLTEQGIYIPDYDMVDNKSDFDKYFLDVRKSIEKQEGWNVTDDLFLGFFSFTKFIMYKDLDLKNWGVKIFNSKTLFNNLFSTSEDNSINIDNGFSEEDVDIKLKISDMHHVMDSDPSQIAVIEDVKAGRNLVIQGPPGTGKSQTIVNMIGELILAGKTVLFVSEKMAALEVVKRRLDHVGLGSFCLELHSRKSKRKDVLKEIEKTINREPPQSVSLNTDIQQLEELRTKLNSYARVLKKQICASGLTPYKLFSMKADVQSYFDLVKREMPHFNITNVESIEEHEFTKTLQELEELAVTLKSMSIPTISKHPWNGIENEMVLPPDINEITASINNMNKKINDISAVLSKIEQDFKIPKKYNINSASDIFGIKSILSSYPTSLSRINVLNNVWNKLKPIKSIVTLIEEYQENIKHIKFNLSMLDDTQLKDKLDLYEKYTSKPLRFLYGNYRRLKKDLKSKHSNFPPKSAKVLEELKFMFSFQQKRNEIRKDAQNLKNAFGKAWKNEDSDTKSLKEIISWISNFQLIMDQGLVTDDTLNYLDDNRRNEEKFAIFDELNELVTLTKETQNKLSEKLKINYEKTFSIEKMLIPFGQWREKLISWQKNIDTLSEWSNYYKIKVRCFNKNTSQIIEMIDFDKIKPEDIVQCYRGNYSDSLLKYVFMNNPELSNFDVDLHKKNIRDFAELDKKIIKLNRRKIVCDIYNSQPKIFSGASPNSSVGIIFSEINRKRKHKPIRKFISSTSDILLKFKPCLMMSPLSVAQFLEPNKVNFDVVIFDEASQVKPEDALGAIARGSQLIVLGDTKQLPPTSFFDHIVDTDDEDENDWVSATTDMESILHMCRRVFPSKTLKWHYRSRHESLIEVSNQEFYDNALLIYPSPDYNTDTLGLKFIHLSNAVYDRGKSSINIKEAKTVAKYAIEHYKKYPNKSLGIGTFNIKQQNAIMEEIDLLLMVNPDVESSLYSNTEEPFFVKNLETIQGDERDVIILSIGFGLDHMGKLSHNFGPLNHDGGERRLNVLITRAREQCIVFSNFKADHLKIDANSPLGLKALKIFLQYAETRRLVTSITTGRDTDSPFEDSVYELLSQEGYNVHKQVGCANYKIDLAIVDPKYPGKYVLGIECDGAQYHSSVSARERDRLRQQKLEELGWKLYRIWSTDWYRNRKKAQENLIIAVKDAINTKSTLISSEENSTITKEDINCELINNNELFGRKIIKNYPEVINYNICKKFNYSPDCDFYELTDYNLHKDVINVVEIEGPVHIEEIIRRIREYYGLKRNGSKITDKVYRAVYIAKQKQSIIENGNFLHVPTKEIRVRDRKNYTPLKIEFISNAELEVAIKLVLKHQYSTPMKELAISVSRIIGFKSTSEQIADYITRVIKNMIYSKKIIQDPNGQIMIARK